MPYKVQLLMEQQAPAAGSVAHGVDHTGRLFPLYGAAPGTGNGAAVARLIAAAAEDISAG